MRISPRHRPSDDRNGSTPVRRLLVGDHVAGVSRIRRVHSRWRVTRNGPVQPTTGSLSSYSTTDNLDEEAFLALSADFEDEDLSGVQLRRNHAAVGVLLARVAEAGLAPDAAALEAALVERPGPALRGVFQFVLALRFADAVS
jgi:hypothetical protein